MKRKNMYRTLSTLLAAAMVAAPALAANTALLSPSPGDLVPSVLVAPTSDALAPGVSREPVDFSWALDPEQALASRPSRITSTSKGYWLDVSAADLRRGVTLDTVSPGAVVRINPAPASGPGVGATKVDPGALDPENLIVRKGGQSLRGTEAMELLVTAQQMAAADLPFVPGTSAFRLRQTLGAGAFLVQAPALGTDAGRFVVHVQEPASALVLSLRASRPHYLHAQGLRVNLKLNDGGEALAASAIRAFVLSPAGRSFPLSFRRAATGDYRATLILDAQEPVAEGLWELQAAVEGRRGDLIVRRAGRTAFQASLPTARLEGTAEVLRPDGALTVKMGVETATAGRYEVRGVLYGTDASGTLKPFAIGHSAAWLPTGRGDLTLSFGKELLAGSGLAAPFEIRDLRLMDQGRMGLLQRQVRGLVID